MYTYYLGKEEVSQYAKDLANRLDNLGESFPSIWCVLGHSGSEIANVVANHLPEDRKTSLSIIPIDYDRDQHKVYFRDEQDEKGFGAASPVLVIDSAVHSGATMLAAVKKVAAAGAQQVCSYSLVVKRCATFVPNFFGVLIEEHDRAFFLLDSIPNNRLVSFGMIRKLEEKDIHRKPDFINSGVPSIDKITMADLWYEVKAKGGNVYVYEDRGVVLGFVSFFIKQGNHAFVDAIAIDKDAQGKGVGKSLIRWAETWARSCNCSCIDLWGVHERLSFYKHVGFSALDEQLDLGLEKYTRMRRKLLYNLEAGLH